MTAGLHFVLLKLFHLYIHNGKCVLNDNMKTDLG
jgi:hypothetical protein